ncbi:MAG: class I SAM-dependent methyltransferase [Thermodesulfobacteriota bacterium]
MEKVKYIVFKDDELLSEAEEISFYTGVPAVSYDNFSGQIDESKFFYFYINKENYELRKYNSSEKGISADFFSGKIKQMVKTKSVKNPLAKAVGIKGGKAYKPFIVDLTAGLGKDSFFLYSLGAKVAGFERNPFLFYLLKKGVNMYFKGSSNKKNLDFFCIDSLSFFQNQEITKKIHQKNKNEILKFSGNLSPDVLYLDPMYPENSRKKSKPKKEMVFLRELTGGDYDSADLFKSVFDKNIKVVVKRPAFADYISHGMKPSCKIESKLVRYDVYLP